MLAGPRIHWLDGSFSRNSERDKTTLEEIKTNRAGSIVGVLAYRVSAAACASGHGIGRGDLESTKAIKRLCSCSYCTVDLGLCWHI